MRRGPKPKSTVQRRLEGNPGKRALNAEEPAPPPLDTDPVFDTPPPELTEPAARAEWTRLAPMLRQCKQITLADRGVLIALCIEWAKYLTATAAVERIGMIVPTPSGYPITNPYLAIANKALGQCNRLWVELGLTPSSRSRVTPATPGESPGVTDAFTEFDEPPTRRPH